MTQKVILGFALPYKKEKQLQKFCSDNTILYKKVTPENYTKTLGSLAGIPGIPAKAGTPAKGTNINQEMLVFSGFEDGELDAVLGAYRSSGLEPIALKAMITMYNIFWTPEILFHELETERKQIADRKR